MIQESSLEFPVENPSIKVLPVDLPTTRRPTGIMTLKNRTLSPVTKLFIECCREVAKPMVENAAGRPTGRRKPNVR